jgi:CelD/BcsL family acetyltransferase involved in cellulose biosynthesis
MRYYWLDPLTDARWPAFVERHPSSSIFHTPGWLRALQKTYGFTPTVLTTAPPGSDLTDGIPFCRIRSRLTGARLVSLPFSDHCQPLGAANGMMERLVELRENEKLKYVEVRPLQPAPPAGFTVSQRFYFHLLDLRPSLEELFRQLHPDCIRRKIRRAGREGVVCETGRSGALIDEFYALQVLTRRRHGLPPQPRAWFRNVVDCMGTSAEVRVARRQGRAVAAIVTLRHRDTAVYKYGCSNAEDNNVGGMQLVFWDAIEKAKAAGMQWMDLGRCDLGDEGLAVFKERWGARRQEIGYLRYPGKPPGHDYPTKFMAKLPKSILILAGRLLYRHMG